MTKLKNSQVTALAWIQALWTVMAFILLKRAIPSLFLNRDLGYALGLCSLACIVGFIKYNFVLKKTVNRIFQRVDYVTSISTIWKIIDRKFLIIIFLMIALGRGMQYIPGLDVTKGFIRFAVGCALLFGSFKFQRLYHLWYARLK